MTSSEKLPGDWDLERIRTVSGWPDARLLDPGEHFVVLDLPGASDYEEMNPEVIINFTDLCLLRESGDEDWYMGHLGKDGSIVCWASYGNDLGEALRAL
jgi:hypothetical protein